MKIKNYLLSFSVITMALFCCQAGAMRKAGADQDADQKALQEKRLKEIGILQQEADHYERRGYTEMAERAQTELKNLLEEQHRS